MKASTARATVVGTVVAAGIALGAGLAARTARAGPEPQPAAARKALVLAFDGYDANRAERLMAEGKLPALSKLRERGGYSRLIPSNPAQSPVSWASITTGWNPGKTGIFDFLRRRDLDARQIAIGLAEPVEIEPLTWWARTGLLCAAAALGGITAAGLMFAVGAKRPHLRKGKKFEIALTFGAALFASAGFVVLRWVPEKVMTARNLRSGEPFWVTLDRAGVPTVTLEAPLSFPADEMTGGCCLAGLGVPDMTGSWGSFSVWSDDPMVPASTETAGRGWYIGDPEAGFDLAIQGPPNPLLSEAAKSAISEEANQEKHLRVAALDWNRVRRRESETAEALVRLRSSLSARIHVTLRRGQDATVVLQDGSSLTLTPGKWSDLLPVTFRANPAVAPRGRVRLLLENAGGPGKPFRLFVPPVQWDLTSVPPNVPLTSPRSFAGELATLGPSETIGWPELTNPVKDSTLGDQAFLNHTYLVMAMREKRLYDRLRRNDWRMLFAMFCEPDRIQHAFLRHEDPLNPRHDPVAGKRFAPEIDRIYVEADRIVGEAVRLAGPDTDVFVISDHGFAPFRRGVNLNNFLRAKGWQTGSGDAGPRSVGELAGASLYFSDVDWTRTKAYAMGLGNGYVNVRGREPHGSVPPEQVDDVVDQIAVELEALRDGDGARVVKKVYRGKDLYHGARSGDAPDFVVAFERGYRVSWQNCLGALDADVITPNVQLWSGDHCSVDPEYVPGVLFSSLPIREGGASPRVEDFAPALLSLFDVAPNDPDGQSFLAPR